MASLRRRRRKACGRKMRFASPEEARAAIAALVANRGPQGPLNPYRCAFCSGWHFGHPPHKMRQAAAARRRAAW